MHGKARLAVLLFIVVLFGVSGIVAQTDPTMESNRLSGGYIILLPEDWTVEEVEDGIFSFSNDEVTLQLYTPEAVADIVGDSMDLDEGTDPVELLVNFFDGPLEPDMAPDDVWEDDSGDNHLAGWNFEPAPWNRKTEGVRMIIILEEGELAVLEARVSGGEIATYESLITEIAQSLQQRSGPTLPGAMSPPDRSTGEPCMLTANWEGVTVRVGPGEHRGLLTYLLEGLPFRVLGQIEADDGSVWWKLDPNDVAPTSGANEVWVPDAGTTTEGDCDLVDEAAAPPIIFGTSSMPEGVESPAPNDPSIITEGTWLVDIGNPLPCGNAVYEYIRPNPEPYPAYIMVTDAFIFGDFGFYMRDASGDYVGSMILDANGEDIVASVVLTLESRTSIIGLITFTRDGCEWPHLATITKQ